jgi:hypothetical protein
MFGEPSLVTGLAGAAAQDALVQWPEFSLADDAGAPGELVALAQYGTTAILHGATLLVCA